MSGRRINDHAFWAGKAEKGMVFPKGAHTKEEHSAEGEGHVGMRYPDTTEDIHRDQMHGAGKMAKHQIKEGYRN